MLRSRGWRFRACDTLAFAEPRATGVLDSVMVGTVTFGSATEGGSLTLETNSVKLGIERPRKLYVLYPAPTGEVLAWAQSSPTRNSSVRIR